MTDRITIDKVAYVDSEAVTSKMVIRDNNRYDLRNVNKPLIMVHLVSNDMQRILHVVLIRNTRERPDVIMFNGEPYDVIDTTCDPPLYRAPMVLEAQPYTRKEKP